jgi:hypothetical protein
MNSEIPESIDGGQMEASHFEKMEPVDFNLTYEQFLYIQHHLPKKYALIEHKNIKKGVVVASAVKLGPEDVHYFQYRLKTCRGSREMLKTLRKSRAAPRELGSKK